MRVVSSESTTDTLCALCVVSMATKALSMRREDVVFVGVVAVFVGVVVSDLLLLIAVVCDNWLDIR